MLTQIETWIESVPQFVIQLYIGAARGRFTLWQLLSLLGSFLTFLHSMISAILKAFSPEARVVEGESTMDQGRAIRWYQKLLLFLWFFLHFLCSVAPITFLSALKNHGSPFYLLTLLYLIAHLVVMSMIVFPGAQWCSRGSKGCPFGLSYWLSSLLQSLFCFISFWISTIWLVSFASVLSPGQTMYGIPNFIWPDSTSHEILKWAYDEKAPIPLWATCNQTDFHDDRHKEDNFWSSFFPPDFFCMNHVVPYLYVIFQSSNVLLGLIHYILLVCSSFEVATVTLFPIVFKELWRIIKTGFFVVSQKVMIVVVSAIMVFVIANLLTGVMIFLYA